LVVVNGGGWGCIYSPQPLPSRCSISANRGRSAPLVRTVRPCTSTTEIPTVSSNSYINGYNALNASSDVRYGSRGRSGRAPWTVREDAIIHFTEPVTFGFFGSAPTRRSAPEAGRSALGLGRCLLFHRTVSSVDLCFLQCSCPRLTLVPGRSALSLFFQKAFPIRNNLRYSGQSI
jgi:hypothetical protein